jgi:hypothetical protein
MLAPIMQFYFYKIVRKIIGAKWARGTCLVAPQKGTRTHQTLAPRNLQRTALAQRFLAQANIDN